MEYTPLSDIILWGIGMAIAFGIIHKFADKGDRNE